MCTGFEPHRWQVGVRGRLLGPREQGAGPGPGLESDCC